MGDSPGNGETENYHRGHGGTQRQREKKWGGWSEGGGAGEAAGAPPGAVEDAVLLALPEGEGLVDGEGAGAGQLDEGIEKAGAGGGGGEQIEGGRGADVG
jgi:hypothetical protein